MIPRSPIGSVSRFFLAAALVEVCLALLLFAVVCIVASFKGIDTHDIAAPSASAQPLPDPDILAEHPDQEEMLHDAG